MAKAIICPSRPASDDACAEASRPAGTIDNGTGYGFSLTADQDFTWPVSLGALHAFNTDGSLLVIRMPEWKSGVADEHFWTAICSPSGEVLLYLRMTRVLVLNGESLLAATEARPAIPGEQRPEPFLTVGELPQRGGI